MTDKQIIIDDYFRKIVDINGKIVDYEIKNSEVSKLVQKIEKYNSYIELKEQECERLKEEVSLLKEINLKLQPIEDVRSLEKCYLQQLDQLKKELEQEKAWHKTADEISKANSEYTKQLKQTLAEIKEIAEENDELLQGYHKEWANNKLILQKISECEVDK